MGVTLAEFMLLLSVAEPTPPGLDMMCPETNQSQWIEMNIKTNINTSSLLPQQYSISTFWIEKKYQAVALSFVTKHSKHEISSYKLENK